jgi:hypothetical protein
MASEDFTAEAANGVKVDDVERVVREIVANERR